MSGTRCESGRACLVLWACALLGCREVPAPPSSVSAVPTADAAPPWSPKLNAPTPPRGMLWVPEGALIAGTPPGRIPRLADQELPGEQIVLHGFFIDIFAYPNEEGAIAQTGVTLAQAESSCAEQNKRLCTELEWERACKGPQNLTYEYGDRYRSDACSTGHAPRMLPSGYRPACRSEFGARDLHGSVWEWTQSRFGRGGSAELFALRGGNSVFGELVGRCANAMAKPAQAVSSDVGFRCCKGEVNQARVSLRIERGPPLTQRGQVDADVARVLEPLLPESVRQTLAGFGPWRVHALWDWRPVANVRLVVGAGCAGPAVARRCGVVVAQFTPGAPELMAWVWAGMYPATVRVRDDAKQIWVYGGDRTSNLRQPASFEWGSVRVGELERKLPSKGHGLTWLRESASRGLHGPGG
jgi:sulfatase modifying factor 1